MNINTYLTRLIEEKGRELDEWILTNEGQIGLTWQHLIDFVSSMPAETKEKVRKTLVLIDFKNGDVFHFLTHCARGMVDALGLNQQKLNK